MNNTALVMTAAGLIGGVAILITVTVASNIPSYHVATVTPIAPSEMPVKETPISQEAATPEKPQAKAVDPSFQWAESRKPDGPSAFHTLAFQYLERVEGISAIDRTVLFDVTQEVYKERGQWREAFVGNEAMADVQMDMLVVRTITEKGYLKKGYQVDARSRGLIAVATKLAIRDWWANNYERQFEPPDNH
jgi:hypothetical protein